MNSVNVSRISVGPYTSNESVPPYPGRSGAIIVLSFPRELDARRCRHIAQLSGNPCKNMTNGLFPVVEATVSSGEAFVR